MDELRDVRLRELKVGELFITRATKLHGLVQQREVVALTPGEEELIAIDVEIMGRDGVLRRKLLHPDVRVGLIGSTSFVL